MKTHFAIILLTAAIFAGTIFLIVDFDRAAEDEVIRRFHAQQLHGVRQLVHEMDEYLRDRSQGAQVLSRFASLQHRDMKKIAADFQEYFQYVKKDYVKAISVYDEKGTIIYSTTEDAIGRNYANCDFSQWAAKKENKGKQFISSLIRVAEDQVELPPYYRFPIVTPIYQETLDPRYPKPTHKFVGVLTITIDLEEVIAAFLPLLSYSDTKQHVWIVDTSGKVLFQPEHPEMVLKSVHRRHESCMRCHVSLDFVDKILAKKQGTIEYSLREQPKKAAAFAPLTFENVTWIIAVNVPLDEVSGFVAGQLARTLLLIGVIAVALVGSSTLIYRSNRSKIRAEDEAKRWREKRELEEKIRESEERYRQLVEISPDAIAVHCEGKIAFVNSAGVRALGAGSADELIGKPALEIVHPDDREMVNRRIKAALAEGKPAPLTEERFLRLDGSVIDVEVAAIATTFQDKPAVQVVVHDITERKRAERALAISLSEQKTIMQTIPDIVFVLDLSGNVVKWNRSLEVVTGYSPEELIGKPTADFFNEEYRPIIAQAIRETLEKGYNEVEIPLPRKDGTLVPYLWNGAPLRDEKGRIIGLAGVGRDLTEHKRAEEALKVSEERQRFILQSLPAAVYVTPVDPEVDATWISGNVLELTGYTASEVVAEAQFWRRRLHPDDHHRVLEAFARAAVSGKVEIEYRWQIKDGQYKWFLDRCTKYQVDNRQEYFGVLIDITQLKRAEEALKESELRFRSLTEFAITGVYLIQEGIFGYVNPVLAAMFGYDVDEIINKLGPLDLTAPEDRDVITENIRKRVEGVIPQIRYSFKGMRKDGQRIDIEVHGARIDYHGKPAIIGTLLDISERKQAEEEIRNLAKFPAENPNPVLRIARDGALLYINEAGLRLLPDWHLQVGQAVSGMLGEAAVQSIGNGLPRVLDLEHGKRVYSFFVAPIVTAGYANLYGRDITERVQAEAALRALSSRQGAILAAVPDIIIEVDNNKVYTWANQAGFEFFGNDVIGKEAAFYFEGEQDTYGVVQPLFNGSENVIYVESWQRRKDGQKRLLAWWCRGLKDEGGNATGALSSARDITERKRAEETLRYSEERFRAIASNTTDHIFMQDRDLRYSFVVNPQLGLTEADIIGKTDFDFLGKEEAENITALKRKVLETGEPVHVEVPLRNLKGETEFFDGSYVPKFDSTGKIDGLIGYFRNITERKQAEIRIRFLANLITNVSDAILATDRQFNIQYWNIAAEKQYGWTSAEVLGRHFIKFIQPQYIGDSRKKVMQKIVQEGSWTGELLHNRRDGKLFPVHVTISEVRNAEGQIIGHVAINRDITEGKQAEEALRASEAKYRDLIERAWDAIFVVDRNGTILLANTRACELLGCEREEALKMNIADSYLVEEKDVVAERIALAEKGGHWRYERAFVRKDGAVFPVEVSIGLLPDGTIQGIMRDITERKRAEDEVRKAKDQLGELNKHLTDVREEERALISREIHDELGQSLTALKIDLSWVREHVAKKPAVKQRLAAMLDVVDVTVKNVQRIAAELRPSILDDLGLAPAIEWYCEEFEKRSGIRIQNDLEDIQSQDPHKNIAFFRILQEALTNVARHANAKHVTITLSRIEDDIKLQILDDGVGFSPDKINSESSLGLIGMRERAKQFGGRFEILSERKKGTTVRISFPIHT